MAKIKSYFIFLSLLISTVSYAQVYEGYIIADPLTDTVPYLMDQYGHSVHSWQFEHRPASAPYLFSDGRIIRPGKVDEPIITGFGVGGLIEIRDWENNVLWNFTWSDEDHQQHHDIQPMPNGNVLILSWERINHYDALAAGRLDLNADLWPTEIIEIEPIGIDGGNVVWEWHLWDHIIQDVNQGIDNYGVISEHPERMNLNFGVIGGTGPDEDSGDWLHANYLDYNPVLDQILFSCRRLNEIYIIDHSTTTEEAAGHSGGNSGKGGDFLFRWGNPMAYDRGDSSDTRLFGPHCPTWIPQGYPGAGNIMVFNNGLDAPYGTFSSVEVIIPITDESGSYIIGETEPFGPLDSYIIFGAPDFYSASQSGCYRLPNGNTIICESNDGHFFETSFSGEIVWEYFHPTPGVHFARGHKYGREFFEFNLAKGDLNRDGSSDILDLVIMVHIIVNGSETVYWQWAADINADESNDVTDITQLVNQLLAS